MAIVLFDTNILIDHLNGHVEAALEIFDFEDAIISSLTWMEVACKMDEAQKQSFQSFLDGAGIRIVHPDDGIMHRAATLRGNSIAHPPKISLPDCIVRATAEASGRIVVTRNPVDFGGEGPFVRVPYDIENGQVVNVRLSLA